MTSTFGIGDWKTRDVINGRSFDRMKWAIWKPYIDEGYGQEYPAESKRQQPPCPPKIVLTYIPAWEPPGSWALPPHFTLNLEPEGKAWQHVNLVRGAYNLGKGTHPLGGSIVNENTEAGIVVQIAICNPDVGKDIYLNSIRPWWTPQRMNTLAWYLGTIMKVSVNSAQYPLYVPLQFPVPFTRPVPPWAFLVKWDDWRLKSGIFGKQHMMYCQPNWFPGDLDTGKLSSAIKSWNTIDEPASVDVSGTLLGEELIEEAGGNSDAGATSEEASSTVIQETSMENKPWRFNPPLHNHNLFVRVDWGEEGLGSDPSRHYDEPRAGDIPLGAVGVERLGKLRLGRIIQHEMSAGYAALNENRWGFRFLYNPTSVTVSASRNDSVYINPASVHNAVISGINQNFQVITFRVFLNRKPDVFARPLSGQDYGPPIDQYDIEGLQRYGTHWDLMALYRVCNGEWNLDDRGKTSDVGLIIPASARLLLGQLNLFGFVESIGWNDELFSGDMVPILTTVDIQYRRHVDIKDVAAFTTLVGGRTTEEEASTDTADAGSGVAADSKPGNDKNAPCPGHNKITVPYGVKGSWSAGHHTGDDYGEAPKGAQVLCTREGVVVHAGYGSDGAGWGGSATDAYGQHVVVETGDVRHGYCHLSVVTARKGEKVMQGSEIGKVGNTGRVFGANGGYHLHYEERKKPYQYGTNSFKPVWGA